MERIPQPKTKRRKITLRRNTYGGTLADEGFAPILDDDMTWLLSGFRAVRHISAGIWLDSWKESGNHGPWASVAELSLRETPSKSGNLRIVVVM